MERNKALPRLQIEEREGIPVVFVTGYLQEQLAIELVREVDGLLRQDKSEMVFDFSACAAINSLAIGHLQAITMKVTEDFQGTLVLAGVSKTIARILELASIVPNAHLASDLTEALARLKAA